MFPVGILSIWLMYVHLKPENVIIATKQGTLGADLENVDEAVEKSYNMLSLYPLGLRNRKAIVIELQMNGMTTGMELDTGAAVSVISKKWYDQIRQAGDELRQSSLKLKMYTGEIVRPEGVGMVDIQYIKVRTIDFR